MRKESMSKCPEGLKRAFIIFVQGIEEIFVWPQKLKNTVRKVYFCNFGLNCVQMNFKVNLSNQVEGNRRRAVSA
jgi:hypothetical protein